jgi:hypothetical protein
MDSSNNNPPRLFRSFFTFTLPLNTNDISNNIQNLYPLFGGVIENILINSNSEEIEQQDPDLSNNNSNTSEEEQNNSINSETNIMAAGNITETQEETQQETQQEPNNNSNGYILNILQMLRNRIQSSANNSANINTYLNEINQLIRNSMELNNINGNNDINQIIRNSMEMLDTKRPFILADGQLESWEKNKYSDMSDEFKTENPTCPITFDDYEDDSMIVTMPCGHNISMDAANQWFKLNHVCPFCRKEFEKREMNDDEYEKYKNDLQQENTSQEQTQNVNTNNNTQNNSPSQIRDTRVLIGGNEVNPVDYFNQMNRDAFYIPLQFGFTRNNITPDEYYDEDMALQIALQASMDNNTNTMIDDNTENENNDNENNDNETDNEMENEDDDEDIF